MVRAIAMFVYIKASFPSALIGQNNGKARWSLEAEFEFLRRRCKFSLFSFPSPPALERLLASFLPIRSRVWTLHMQYESR